MPSARAVGHDRDGDVPVFFAQLDDAPLPDAASFTLDRNDPRAAFNWNPTPADIGEHLLRLGAFDGRGGETIADADYRFCPWCGADFQG